MNLWAGDYDDTFRVDAWERAAAGFGARLEQVAEADLERPTPCSEWNVAQLIDHVTEYQGLLPRELGAAWDAPEGLVERWDAVVTAARETYAKPGAMSSPVAFGPMEVPAAERLITSVLDVLIHTWDLARATGADETLDPELCQMVLHAMTLVEDFWRIPDWYGEALPDHEVDDPQVALLRFVGRDA